jgi:hypothetical protein
MRTSGRKIRKGERSRATCDYCGARYDRRDLVRDASGLLRCLSEGDGRDTVTLNEANVAAAEAWADRKIPEPHDPGMYDKEEAERQLRVIFITQENDGFLLTEGDEPILAF